MIRVWRSRMYETAPPSGRHRVSPIASVRSRAMTQRRVPSRSLTQSSHASAAWRQYASRRSGGSVAGDADRVAGVGGGTYTDAGATPPAPKTRTVEPATIEAET